MAKKQGNAMQVVCYRGQTIVNSKYIDAEFVYRHWLLRVNPALLFPEFRKEHRKIIKVNGKKIGWAEIRGGCLPLKIYDLKGTGLRTIIRRWIRKHLGLMLRSFEKGYIAVGIGHFRYVVTKSYTEAGFVTCEVYDVVKQFPIGRFSFTSDFADVYAAVNCDGVFNTLQIILGYVADTIVYDSAALSLNKTINIHF